jgi:hypothetical protein
MVGADALGQTLHDFRLSAFLDALQNTMQCFYHDLAVHRNENTT